jgi:hypothetical protein
MFIHVQITAKSCQIRTQEVTFWYLSPQIALVVDDSIRKVLLMMESFFLTDDTVRLIKNNWFFVLGFVEHKNREIDSVTLSTDLKQCSVFDKATYIICDTKPKRA